MSPTADEAAAMAVDTAVAAAAAAADAFAATPSHMRASMLEALADALEAERDKLVPVADEETHLGPARLAGELARTTFQLRGFARVLREGAADAALDEPAVAGPPPAGRPRLKRVRVPVGPVAMFSASNFPFAFSVLGGDTASALAAGCPVVVKAHPAHPRLSRLTAALASRTIAGQGLPAGIFQFIEGEGVALGVRLVQAPAIAAVAFTGSFQGGTALARVAAERPRPIPFFGELGSVNPVVVLPACLEHDAERRAHGLAESMAMGSGQFCTSPGVVVVEQGAAGDAFVRSLAAALQSRTCHPMLSAGIRAAYERGVEAWRQHPSLRPLVDAPDRAPDGPGPFLAQVDAQDFMHDHRLHAEVFGPAALIVRTQSIAEACGVLRAIGGSLTVTLWGVPETAPDADACELVRCAMAAAGRVLFAGVPTGVSVTAAQHHGGPYPASTTPASTSVGYAAMDRFLRPVALQDPPDWLP